MTDSELQQARATEVASGRPSPCARSRTRRAFLESVGFCLLYPMRPPVAGSRLRGSLGGSGRSPAHLATAFLFRSARPGRAGADGAPAARACCFRSQLVRRKQCLPGAASVFPYFYALVGERNPKQAPKADPRSEYSQLACDAFEVIRRDGPISKQKLGEKLGGSLSAAALDRGLWRTVVAPAHHACRLQARAKARPGMCSIAGRPTQYAKESASRSAKRSPRCSRSIWIAWSPPISRNWKHSSATSSRARA